LLETLFVSSYRCTGATNVLCNLGIMGSSLPKMDFGAKLMEPGLREHPKIWDPLFISVTTKLATSNVVYNFFTKLRTKIGRGPS